MVQYLEKQPGGEEHSRNLNRERIFKSICYYEATRLAQLEDDPNFAGTIATGLRELAYAVDVATTGEPNL